MPNRHPSSDWSRPKAKKRRHFHKQPLKKTSAIRKFMTSVCLMTASTLTACQDSAGNKESAVYSYQNGTHTFLVSHAFNANVYQDIGSDAFGNINPDLARPSVLFTCVYELQLNDAELQQCAGSTQIDRYQELASGQTMHMTDADVWRLMVLREDKVRLVSQNAAHLEGLAHELQSEGSPTAASAAINMLAQASSTNPQLMALSPQMNLSGGTLGNDMMQVLKGIMNGKKGQIEAGVANSLGCQAVLQTSSNPLRALSEELAELLGLGNNQGFLADVVPGILSTIGGSLMGDTALGGAMKTAQEIATEACARDILSFSTSEFPEIAHAQLSPSLTLHAMNAIAGNNPAELKRVLTKEFERDREQLKKVNPRVLETLSRTFEAVDHKSLSRLRDTILSFSLEHAAAWNHLRCIAPPDFSTKVLRRALTSPQRPDRSALDTDAELNAHLRCPASTSSVAEEGSDGKEKTPDKEPVDDTWPKAGKQPGSGAGQQPAQPPKPPVDNGAEIARLEQKIASLEQILSQVLSGSEEQRKILEDLLTNQNVQNVEKEDEPGSAENVIPESINTTTDKGQIVANYRRSNLNVSALCLDPTVTNAQDLTAVALQERLDTCQNTSATPSRDGEHIYGRFSDKLRMKCAEESQKSASSAATCYCSCRWGESWHDWLAKKIEND